MGLKLALMLGMSSLAILVVRRSMRGSQIWRGSGVGILPRGTFTSPYGMRRGRMHQGIDISAPEGTEIRSVGPGRVIDVSPDGQRHRYGNTVIVEHPDGSCTMHAHMLGFGPGIEPGVWVQAGTVLGYVGGTQLPEPPMTPHIHFEVHQQKALDENGRVIVNPKTPKRYEPVAWLAQHRVRMIG